VVGLVGAAGTLLAIGLACAESGRFELDPKRRVVEWRRRWALVAARRLAAVRRRARRHRRAADRR
jgi:hypothetical protein